MPPNYEQIDQCIREVEQEILRVGGERCDGLRQGSQLCAVFLLLLRCCSLLRSMIQLYRSEALDAFDSVRRSLVETWHLAFQFRLQDQDGQIGRWLAAQPDSWSADIRRLEEYARTRGQQVPDLGRLYGALSGLAHPTREAAENSAAVTLKRRGIPNADNRALAEAVALFEGESTAHLYRLLWLIFDQDASFVPLHLNEANMREAFALAERQQNPQH